MTAKKVSVVKKAQAKPAVKKAVAKPVVKDDAVVVAKIKLTPDQEKVFKFLNDRTNEAFSKYFKADTTGKAFSDKAVKLAALLPNFGGYEGNLRLILEALIGEKLPGGGSTSIPGDQFLKGACIVPLTGDGGHNYGRKICMALDNGPAYMLRFSSGDKGNTLTQSIKSLRLPTEEEIREFIVAQYPSIVKHLALIFV